MSLTWDPVVNATNYQILRSSNHGAFTVIGAPLSNSFVDSSLTPNTTYLYQVRAADASTLGSPSSVDLATTILFTDDPVSVGSTVIKAVHVTELRTAVNAVRHNDSSSTAFGSQPTATSGASPRIVEPRIRRHHGGADRTTLDGRAACAQAAGRTDPGLTAGGRIKAAHYRELRAGVK